MWARLENVAAGTAIRCEWFFAGATSIICRALCDIFNEPLLADRLAFRGGTAINKLLFRQPLRYSERS
ncbi:MAG: hypothetical protein A3H96_07390 [Acidobacteria bacterium RIFCSPLOWO2_02_FULL_67_36]|nr:MAG: hypothetical protein A3H96_07390 [Acidobacteria bacterium RIFCSPLOWO2_02_FULL_67_36]OFW22241.1 MAG: hypothetical protein A3G21_20225 [Acidobacteria bacterium RIFCSPLOWO2_12_FULL_66_21]